VAVFPDRIILKNSTDSQATIEAAIGTGGADEITQGEIVLGVLDTDVKFYTKAGDGSIVTLGGTGTGPYSLGQLTDVDLSTPATDGQVIAYSSTSGNWEPVTQSSSGLQSVEDDPSPRLGGDLNVNSKRIVTTGGTDVVIAPSTTGDFVIRGNNTDGSIRLNCSANTHGVTIQSPPHSAAATYTLVLPVDTGTSGQVLATDGTGTLSWANNVGGGGYLDPLTTDGDIVIRSGGVTTRLGIGAEGQVLKVSSGLPVWAAESGGGGAVSINDLTDVDTNTTQPTSDQVLVWDGSNWVPGNQVAGGSGAGIYLTETQLASGGTADFVGLGYSGILHKVTSDLAAWIVLYSSDAERTADASRAYDTDPTPGSGVLFEAYVAAGGTVIATPGTTYLNNDATLTEAVYAAVRSQAGIDVDATVTFSAYGLAAITSVSGGTFGSGV